MADKPKGGIGLLLLGKPKGEPDSEKSDSDDNPKTLAAQGLIDAIKAGDADEVVSAFETLQAACRPVEIDD